MHLEHLHDLLGFEGTETTPDRFSGSLLDHHSLNQPTI